MRPQKYAVVPAGLCPEKSDSFVCKSQAAYLCTAAGRRRFASPSCPMKAPRSLQARIPSEAPYFSVCYGEVQSRELFERHFKLMYVVSGTAVLSAGGVTLSVLPGQAVFVGRGFFSRIRLQPASEQGFRMVGLNFSDKFLKRYAQQHIVEVASGRRPGGFERLPEDPWVEALFLPLVSYAGRGLEPDALLVDLKLQEAMHLLRNRYPDFLRAMYAGPGPAVRLELRDFMEAHFMYHAPLERFAELSGRSLSTFRREFRAVFGENAGQWLIRRRLEEACRMMAGAGLRPSEVYWETGFETLAHFSRCFRRTYGCTPTEFRRMHASGAAGPCASQRV